MDPIYKILEGFRPLTEAAPNFAAYDQKLGGQGFSNRGNEDNSIGEPADTIVPTVLVPQLITFLDSLGFKPVSLAQIYYKSWLKHHNDILEYNLDGYGEVAAEDVEAAAERYGSVEKYSERMMEYSLMEMSKKLRPQWVQFVKSPIYEYAKRYIEPGTPLVRTLPYDDSQPKNPSHRWDELVASLPIEEVYGLYI